MDGENGCSYVRGITGIRVEHVGILVVGPRLESATMTTEEVGVARELLTVLVQIEWLFHFQLERVKTKIYLCLPPSEPLGLKHW